MEGKDNIKELFGEKLGGFEANVRPELWANISSQIGTTVSVASTAGATLFTKTIIGISVAASIAVVSYFVFTDNKSKELTPNKSSSTPQKESIQNEKEKYVSVVKDKTIEKGDLKNEMLNINVFENVSSNIAEINIPAHNSIEQNITQPLIVSENKEEVNKPIILQNDQIVTVIKENNVPESVLSSDDIDYIGVLPNVFTPNGDRINDVLSIETKDLSDFSIVVIDKNSKIVYQSTDANFVWDGTTLNGELVAKGSYIYYITARNSKGELISKHSMLNIETDR